MSWGRHPGRLRGNNGESVKSCLVHWAVSKLLTTSACLKPGCRFPPTLTCLMGQPPCLTPVLPTLSPPLCPHPPGLPFLLAPSLRFLDSSPVPSPPCQTSLVLCLLFLKVQPRILTSSRVTDCNTDFVYCILVAQGLASLSALGLYSIARPPWPGRQQV